MKEELNCYIFYKNAGDKYATNINTKEPLYTNKVLVSYQTFNTVIFK